MRRWLFRILTHLIAVAAGIAAGIYMLPILIAPPDADAQSIEAVADSARYSTTLDRYMDGSDWLHWGEGLVYLGDEAIALDGRLSPGPDFALYLVDEVITNGEDFMNSSAARVRIGPISGFGPQIIPVQASVRLDDYQSLVIWCDAFEQFITASRYRDDP